MSRKSWWIKLVVAVIAIAVLLVVLLFVYVEIFRYLMSGRGMSRTSLDKSLCVVPIRRRVTRAAGASMHGIYNPTWVRLPGTKGAEATFVVGYRLCTAHMGNAYLDTPFSGGHSNRFLTRIVGKAMRPPFDAFDVDKKAVTDAPRLVRNDGKERTVEDVRLFVFRQQVWGVATVHLTDRHAAHYPVLLRFDRPHKHQENHSAAFDMVYCGTFDGHDRSVMHKNWVGLESADGRMLVHRDTYPELVVSRVRDPGGRNFLEPFVCVSTLAPLRTLIDADVRCIRNTSNWVSWNDDTWAFLAHTKVFPQLVMFYRTALVLVCKKTLVVTGHTPWLNLDAANEDGHGGAPIQFASALWRDETKVYIGMGINDSMACLQSFHARDFDTLLARK
jgi:hypothetical protein